MANFCLPKEIADKLNEAAKNGEIDIVDMYKMTSEGRRELFTKWVDKKTAQNINAGFEKAINSQQRTALKKWAEDVFSPSEKKTPKFKDVISRIDDLNNLGVLTPENQDAFLQDLVAEKLGATISAEDAAKIAEKATKIQKFSKETNELGLPSMEYWKAKKEMEDYLNSLTPNSKLRVLTQTIAKGNMLFRISSIMVNINSNAIEGSLQAINRRYEERTFKGLNGDFGAKVRKYGIEVYRKYGYDITRMDTLAVERKTLGEEVPNSQGKGAVRATARWFEDKIFNLTQGTPDSLFANLAFNDRADLASTRIAYGEGLTGSAAKKRALEIYKDAIKIEPLTKEGGLVREMAVADAKYSTFTDKKILSDKALQLRSVMNIGDLRLGDLQVPFVKTTANAIQAALDTSGITVPIEAVVDMVKTVKLVREGEAWGVASKKGFNKFGVTMVRAGLGMTAAFLVANAIKPEDFIGEYPTSEKERQLLALRNANTNSIKIGNRWISTDWFGPLAAPVVGFLYAKKYGDNLGSYWYSYFKGTAFQSTRIPGLQPLADSIKSLKDFLNPENHSDFKKMINQAASFSVQFVSSRSIPGFVQDIAKATDTTNKDTSGKENVLAPFLAAIPGLRQHLPEKKNVFGETQSTEGWKVLIFGGRLKTDRNDPVINELIRLDSTGNLPTITDVSKTSTRAKQLKVQIGETKFNEAMQYFGKNFKDGISELIQSSDYQDLTPEEQQKAINKIKDSTFSDMLSEYNYEKPEK
jgi:hypothetical protein